MKSKSIPIKKSEFTLSVERALQRAKERAYDTARLHNTPIYIWKDGKVVAIKPQAFYCVGWGEERTPTHAAIFSVGVSFCRKVLGFVWLTPTYALIPVETRSASRIKRREADFWQRRFWEHQIRDDRDFERCVDYIHYNPVKHRLAQRAKEWPYSTFHRFVSVGV